MFGLVRFVSMYIFEISSFYNFYTCEIKNIYVLRDMRQSFRDGGSIW